MYNTRVSSDTLWAPAQPVVGECVLKPSGWGLGFGEPKPQLHPFLRQFVRPLVSEHPHVRFYMGDSHFPVWWSLKSLSHRRMRCQMSVWLTRLPRAVRQPFRSQRRNQPVMPRACLQAHSSETLSIPWQARLQSALTMQTRWCEFQASCSAASTAASSARLFCT